MKTIGDPDLKRQLHCARSTLQYWKGTKRPTRGVSREDGIRKAQIAVDLLAKLYDASRPVVPTLSTSSDDFIGPRRVSYARGDGPTIICRRCECEKDRAEFYKIGTVCKQCMVKRAGEWAKKNTGKRRVIARAWDERNKESRLAAGRSHYHKNREERLAYGKTYYRNNREKKNAWTREYLRQRKKTDPKWRALLTWRRRMWILFKSVGKKKNIRSAQLLGIDKAGLLAHLESLWLPGMSWENYGRKKGVRCWELDHIKPVSLFDHTDLEQAKACWNWKNLQPLWSKDNLAKRDTWEPTGTTGKYIDLLNGKISASSEIATGR